MLLILVLDEYFQVAIKTRPKEMHPKTFLGENHFLTGKISWVFEVCAACI